MQARLRWLNKLEKDFRFKTMKVDKKIQKLWKIGRFDHRLVFDLFRLINTDELSDTLERMRAVLYDTALTVICDYDFQKMMKSWFTIY